MPSNYDRREFLGKGVKAGAAFTLLGAGGTLLDACGSSSSSTTTTLKKAVALQVGVNVPPKSAKLGGSVTMGTEAEEAGMDPTYAHFDSTGVLYARCVYDPLAMVTFDGKIVPYLAESITPNSTYTKWMIKMRPNIVFTDGTPCDAKAMKFCMDAFQASSLVNFALNYWDKNATSIVDDLTIQINMNAPWVPFAAWLTGYIGGQIAYMFSPAAYKKHGETYFDAHPVGTGPFKLTAWTENESFACERNPSYWRKDAMGRQLPYLDNWTYRPLPLVETRLTELESNSIQMMHTDDDPTIVALETRKGLDILLDNEVGHGEPDCGFDMINTSDPMMSDITLRQAAAYAFDQVEYCKVIGKGIVEPINGPFPPPSPYAGPTGYPNYDLAKAQSLIKQWSTQHGGKPPTITYTTTNGANPAAVALVQSFYKAAGFELTINQVAQAQLIDQALSGKYQIFSWRQFANIDPDINYVFWTKAAGIVNFARNYDPQIDKAMDTARQSSDPSVRLEQYQNVAKRFAVDLPYIWAERDVWCIAATTPVQNWNNPSVPDMPGVRGLSMLSGIIWPTEVWVDQS